MPPPLLVLEMKERLDYVLSRGVGKNKGSDL